MNHFDEEEVRRVYRKASQISGLATMISGIEILAAYFGFKPAMAEANTGVYDEKAVQNFSKIKEICDELDLKFAVSKYKYIINSPKGIFKEIPMDDPRPGSRIIGISKDMNKAISAVAHYHWKMMDNRYGRSFGELMGYPSCCLDFGDFLAEHRDDPDNFGFKNAAFETLKRSDGVAWQLNVFSPQSFLSHFPCTFTCKSSIDYVNQVIELLLIADPEMTKNNIRAMKESASLYWTCVDKVMLFGDFEKRDKMFRAGEIKYYDVMWPIGSENYYQENDGEFLNEMKRVWGAIREGDRVVVTLDEVIVYKGADELIRSKKDNPFSPVLVKPDIV